MSTVRGVELRGPVFDTPAVRRAVSVGVGELLREYTQTGKKEVKADLYKKHGVDSGAYKRKIHGRVKGNSGKVYASNLMIALWLEGLLKRNSTTRFKGYQVFARARARMDRQANAIVDRASARMAKKLNGF